MEIFSFKLQIREGSENEYVRRHQAVYPELLKAFGENGIKTYNIFMDGTTLYAYMEAKDIESALKAIQFHPANIQWQKFMSDILIADENGITMTKLTNVFSFNQ
ncbi:MAG: L-rhamnose mutarotase [Firmicutes bacterium]|nr:L-rhamnose mutarotase [Bacillota bacterium]